MKIRIYDPPSGWKYGFPKEYSPMNGECLRDTLIRDGYPMKELRSITNVDGEVWGVRFWEGTKETCNKE